MEIPIVKKLSLLVLCALAVSKPTQAMSNDVAKNALICVATGALPFSALRQELASNRPLLHQACKEGDLNKVKVLLAAGASLNAQDKDGFTPLQKAAFNWRLEGNRRTFEYLINNGASLDTRNKAGRTLLHYATYLGDAEMAQALIEHGASVNVQDTWGDTPLYHAFNIYFLGGDPYDLEKVFKKIVNLLIKHGACIDIKNSFNSTPLHRASSKGYKEVVKLFLKHGACVDSKDKYGETPLHDASSKHHDEVAKLLVCTSFFPPCLSQAINHQASLQAQCLIALLKNLDDFDEDSLNKHIIPSIADDISLDPKRNNLVQLIADHAPLKLQQALVTYWQQQASPEGVNKQKLFLSAHCNRHLSKVKSLVAIRNDWNRTARDHTLSTQYQTEHDENRRNNIITLIDHINQAQDFDQLHEELKKSIIETIKNRLLII